MAPPPEPDAAKLRSLREALPATLASIYLNTGTAGPLPLPTARAMAELEDLELRLGRADPPAWDDFLERMAEARATLAVPLGAKPAELALTHSATDGLNQAVQAIPWRPGDEAITTDQEHPGLLGPLLAARERLDLRLTIVPADPDADRMTTAVRAALTPRTRLVALSHVTWTTGALLPVAEVAELARLAGAWTVVDGAQSVGALPLEVASLGVDLYAFSGQKWLLGPEGSGGLWASQRAVDGAQQGAAGYLSYEHLSPALDGRRWPDARRFEATTFHRPSVVGLARSVGWLAMQVGLPWAFARTAALARDVAVRLSQVPGVEVVTPMEQMAGLVSFRLAGWPAEEAVAALATRIQALARTIPDLDLVRLSVAWYDTEQELDQVVGLIAEMAATSPADLPRRPALVVLRPERQV